MNKLLLLGLLLALGSCDKAAKVVSSQEQQEKIVADFIRKTTNDPDSYQPVNFDTFEPFMRSDSANFAAIDLMNSDNMAYRQRGYALLTGPAKDSLTQVGSMAVHVFRVKKKMGSLVLDSALFVIFKGGKVAAYSANSAGHAYKPKY